MFRRMIISLLALSLLIAITGLPGFASSSGQKVKAYRNIEFGITRGELIRRIDEDDKIKSSGHSSGWENRDNWTEFDWTYEYASRDIWVYLGDSKYDLIANFYGNEEDPNGGMGDSGFVESELMRLWFMSQLESYFDTDLVIKRRDYLVRLITKQYGESGKRQEVEPVNLDEYETKFSHIWYSEQTEQQKHIKIGVECSSSGNYYLAVMAIEQPELVAKREQAERKKESEEAEEESQDF